MKRKIRTLPSNCDRRTGWNFALGTAFQRLGFATCHQAEAVALLVSPEKSVGLGQTVEAFFQAAEAHLEDPIKKQSWLATAHLVAAAESLYAACELMAPIALWACVRGQHSEVILRNLTLEKIAPQLPKQAQAEMRSFLKLKPFKHLRAFVHVSKQRHLLMPHLGWDAEASSSELCVPAFTYSVKPIEAYDSVRVRDFLDGHHSQIVSQLSRIGEALVEKMY